MLHAEHHPPHPPYGGWWWCWRRWEERHHPTTPKWCRMSRRAHGAVCRCGAAILAGDDGDVAAVGARVDPRHLNRTGELLAVIDRRTTYALDPRGALHRRDRWTIRAPARGPVLASHQCGRPLPVHWLTPQPTPAILNQMETPF